MAGIDFGTEKFSVKRSLAAQNSQNTVNYRKIQLKPVTITGDEHNAFWDNKTLFFEAILMNFRSESPRILAAAKASLL